MIPPQRPRLGSRRVRAVMARAGGLRGYHARKITKKMMNIIITPKIFAASLRFERPCAIVRRQGVSPREVLAYVRGAAARDTHRERAGQDARRVSHVVLDHLGVGVDAHHELLLLVYHARELLEDLAELRDLRLDLRHRCRARLDV